jgi:hypothetical protein
MSATLSTPQASLISGRQDFASAQEIDDSRSAKYSFIGIEYRFFGYEVILRHVNSYI